MINCVNNVYQTLNVPTCLPEPYWWVQSSSSGHCRWRRRGRWGASPGCSSACWRAPCPACSWSEPPPSNNQQDQKTTSSSIRQQRQSDDFLFRHFQVKLSESRKTELSIKLALPAFSLWCFDDKCTKVKQTGERFEMMLTSFPLLTSDKILIATEGVKSYIFPVVPGGTVADRETAWKLIFLYIAL